MEKVKFIEVYLGYTDEWDIVYDYERRRYVVTDWEGKKLKAFRSYERARRWIERRDTWGLLKETLWCLLRNPLRKS